MEKKVSNAAKLRDRDGTKRTRLVHTSPELSFIKNTEAATDQVFDNVSDEEEDIHFDSQSQNDVDDRTHTMEATKRNTFQNINITKKYFHLLDNGDEIPLRLPNLTHLTDHHGIVVTVLDMRYIFTYVNQNFAPILVTFEGAVFGKETIVRCRVVHGRDDSCKVLDEVEDGTKVKFDAVLQNSRFHALLVWTGRKKPSYQLIPDQHANFCLSEHTGTASILYVLENHAILKAQTEGENLIVKVHKNDFFINGRSAGGKLASLPRLDPTLGLKVKLYQMLEGNDEGTVSWICSAAWIGCESPHARTILTGQMYSICAATEVVNNEHMPKCIFFDLDAYFQWTGKYLVLKFKDPVENAIQILTYVGDIQKDLRVSPLTPVQEENGKITVLKDPLGADGLRWIVLIKNTKCIDDYVPYQTGLKDLEFRNAYIVHDNNAGKPASQKNMFLLNSAKRKKRHVMAKTRSQSVDPVVQPNIKGHASQTDITPEVVRRILPSDSTGELEQSIISAGTFKYTLIKGDLNTNSDKSLSFLYTKKKRVQIICLSTEKILDYEKRAHPWWPCTLLLQHQNANSTEKPVLTPVLGWIETNFQEAQIVLNQKVVSYDKNSEVLSLKNKDGDGASVKDYLLLNDNVYMQTSLCHVSEFANRYRNSFVHAVVTEIPATERGGKHLTKQVVFLSRNMFLTLVSRTAFICAQDLTPADVKLQKKEGSNSEWPSSKVINNIFDEIFKGIVTRREIISQCPLGNNGFSYSRNFSDAHSLQVSKAQLVHVTDEYAILKRSNKNRYIICLKSDLFYQGQRYTSDKNMFQNSKKNFTVIESKTSETMVGTHKIDGLGEMGWLYSGPPILFTHNCLSHKITILPCGEEFSSTSNTLVPCPPSSHSIRHRQLGFKFNFEASDQLSRCTQSNELKVLLCEDGKNLSISDYADFDAEGIMLGTGRILYFYGSVMVVIGERCQTKYWCHFRKVFINGKWLWHTSQLVEFMLKRKVLTFLYCDADPLEILTDVIDKHIVICFDSLHDETKYIIHSCDNHSPVLISREEYYYFVFDDYIDFFIKTNATDSEYQIDLSTATEGSKSGEGESVNNNEIKLALEKFKHLQGSKVNLTDNEIKLAEKIFRQLEETGYNIEVDTSCEENEGSLKEIIENVKKSRNNNTSSVDWGQEVQEDTAYLKQRKTEVLSDSASANQPIKTDKQSTETQILHKSDSAKLLRVYEEKSNKSREDIREITVRAKNKTENIEDVCTCLESDFKIAIVEVEDAKIFLRKEDVIFHNKPLPDSATLVEIMPPDEYASIHFCEMQRPVHLYDHLVTHVAIFAYFGQKPSNSKAVLQEWRKKPVKTLCCEYCGFEYADEDEYSIFPTDVIGKIVKVTNCNAVMEFKDIDNPEVYRRAICKKTDIIIDKIPVSEKDSLKSVMKPFLDYEWMATLSQYTYGSSKDYYKYEASKMWIGAWPSTTDSCQSSDTTTAKDKGKENNEVISDSGSVTACDDTKTSSNEVTPENTNNNSSNNNNEANITDLIELLGKVIGVKITSSNEGGDAAAVSDVSDKPKDHKADAPLCAQPSSSSTKSKKKKRKRKEESKDITTEDNAGYEETPGERQASDEFEGSVTQDDNDEMSTNSDVVRKKKKKKKKKKGVRVLGNNSNLCVNDSDPQNSCLNDDVEGSRNGPECHTVTPEDDNDPEGYGGKAEEEKKVKPVKEKGGDEESDESFANENECEDSNDHHCDLSEASNIPGIETREKKSAEKNTDDSRAFGNGMPEPSDDAVCDTEASKTVGRVLESNMSAAGVLIEDGLVETLTKRPDEISFLGSGVPVYEKVTDIPDFDEDEVISFTKTLKNGKNAATTNFNASSTNAASKNVVVSFQTEDADCCAILASKDESKNVEGVSHDICAQETSRSVSTESDESITYSDMAKESTSGGKNTDEEVDRKSKKLPSPQQSDSRKVLKITPSEYRQYTNIASRSVPTSPTEYKLSVNVAPRSLPTSPSHHYKAKMQPPHHLTSTSSPNRHLHSTSLQPFSSSGASQSYNNQYKKTPQSHPHPMHSQQVPVCSSCPNIPVPQLIRSPIPSNNSVLSQSYPEPRPPYHSPTLPPQVGQLPRPPYPPSASSPHPGPINPQYHTPHCFYPQQNMQCLPPPVQQKMHHYGASQFMPVNTAQPPPTATLSPPRMVPLQHLQQYSAPPVTYSTSSSQLQYPNRAYMSQPPPLPPPPPSKHHYSNGIPLSQGQHSHLNLPLPPQNHSASDTTQPLPKNHSASDTTQPLPENHSANDTTQPLPQDHTLTTTPPPMRSSSSRGSSPDQNPTAPTPQEHYKDTSSTTDHNTDTTYKSPSTHHHKTSNNYSPNYCNEISKKSVTLGPHLGKTLVFFNSEKSRWHQNTYPLMQKESGYSSAQQNQSNKNASPPAQEMDHSSTHLRQNNIPPPSWQPTQKGKNGLMVQQNPKLTTAHGQQKDKFPDLSPSKDTNTHFTEDLKKNGYTSPRSSCRTSRSPSEEGHGPQKPSVPSGAVLGAATGWRKKEAREDDEFTRAEDAVEQAVVIDVHRTTGQLQAQHGKTLFFSRNHCLLMGVSLKLVELWHVLTIGLKVEYTAGPTGVGAVWVGKASGHTGSELQSQLQDWCRNNHVPPETTEKLLAAASKRK